MHRNQQLMALARQYNDIQSDNIYPIHLNMRLQQHIAYAQTYPTTGSMQWVIGAQQHSNQLQAEIHYRINHMVLISTQMDQLLAQPTPSLAATTIIPMDMPASTLPTPAITVVPQLTTPIGPTSQPIVMDTLVERSPSNPKPTPTLAQKIDTENRERIRQIKNVNWNGIHEPKTKIINLDRLYQNGIFKSSLLLSSLLLSRAANHEDSNQPLAKKAKK